MKALDLFAGTGWGVACQRIGIKEYGVEIMPEACATREANGMETVYNDVWDGLAGKAEYPEYELLISSPPCQTFSTAGKGAGREALDDVLGLIAEAAYKLPGAGLREIASERGLDDRTALVLTPLAHVWRDKPKYVAWEQVPAVLPVWEACARVMREWGYSVDTAVLHAEQYGVPQTRKRAILVARLEGEAKLPKPTHSKYYSRTPEKLDEGVLPWVSMAEALGWGAIDQPSHTIVGGSAHGPDRYASGGNAVRKALDAKIGTTQWIDKPDQSVSSKNTEFTQRFDAADVAALQTYPTTAWGYTNRPAMTVVNSVGRGLGGGSGAQGQIKKAIESGDFIPSIHAKSDAYAEATRITVPEAGVLQSYERPFVWCGTKTKQFLQIGNAVPPLLAEVILRSLLAK